MPPPFVVEWTQLAPDVTLETKAVPKFDGGGPTALIVILIHTATAAIQTVHRYLLLFGFILII